MLKKAEITAKIAEQTGLTKADVEKVLEAHSALIVEELKNNEEFTLAGIGKIKPTHSNERTGRNPRTGETIVIPASNSARLAVAKALKDALN